MLMAFFTGILHSEEPTKLRPKGFVNDYAGFLDQKTSSNINAVMNIISKKTGAQVVFVSVKTLEDYSIEEYSVKLFKHWKIGQKGKDNGVLLLVSKQERKARIEVGYGLEGALPDAYCGDLIREMIRHFQGLGYNEGITYGMFSIGDRTAKEYNLDLKQILQSTSLDYDNIRNPNHKMKGKSSLLGTLFYLLLLIMFISGRMGFLPFLLLSSMSGGGGYWRGGGGFGGGSGGSFGGFGGGGGFSGGGGASGSW
jgi:uncharacterized protein